MAGVLRRLALLAASVGASSAVNAESLSVRSSVAWPATHGHQVVVDFVTDGLTGGLAFELAFDPGLTLDAQGPVVSVPNAAASCRSPAPGRVKCLVHSPVGSAALGTGTVTLACDVPQLLGEYPVSIVSANAYDQQAVPRTLQATAGMVAVQLQPTVSLGAVAIAEGNAGVKKAQFTVSLAPVSASPVTVRASTRPGTAMPGVDYVSLESVQLTIPAGASGTTAEVDVLGDVLAESNETFTLALHEVQGAAGEGAQAKGTILDDDKAQLRIADASVVEGDAGQTTATFVVSLSRPSPLPVTFDFTTVAGTAAAGIDFETTSRSARLIDPGRTRMVVEVPIMGDANSEPDETFSVVLSNVAGADLADGSGVGTIANDDAQPAAVVSIGAVQGVGSVSPMLGEVVELRGVVTGVASNGYFLQSEQDDGNPLSSDGIFVQSNVAGVRAGSLVRSRGMVAEHRSASKGLAASETRLVEQARIVERNGLALPKAVRLALPVPAWKQPEALESTEGMLVHVDALEVVGPSTARRDARGRLQPTGMAQVVAGGVPRTYDVGTGNPERLALDTAFLGGSVPLSVNVGDRLTGAVAVVGVEAGHYALRLLAGSELSVASGAAAVPAPQPASGRAAIAFMRLAPGHATADVDSAMASASRVSRAICAMAAAPDVIVLESSAPVPFADALEEVMRADAPALSGCAAGTRYAFDARASANRLLLVKSSHPGEPGRSAAVASVEEVGTRATYRGPDGRQAPLFDEAPRWLVLRLAGPSGKRLVLDALLVSLDRAAGADGPRMLRRKAQDAFVERLLRGRLASSPSARIVVLGNPVGTGFAGAPLARRVARGTPTVSPGAMRDVAAGVPPLQRYTAVESGDAVQRDAILVSPVIAERLRPTVQPVRINADFSEDLADEEALPLRLSDQDPLVLELDFE